MAVYVCGHCGNQIDEPVSRVCRCGSPMRQLDGIVLGNGVYTIWRDGVAIWSGTALDAVNEVQKFHEFFYVW